LRINFQTYLVKSITRNDCKEFILNIHYAKRWPSISYAFGLFSCEELIGIVTYGTPPSSGLRQGLAGKENSHLVLELNRLVLKYNYKNEASFLVAKSLKLLPKGLFIVSFADTEQNHKGTVYQASNFGYYGLSAKRTDWKVKGKEHLHGISIADEFRGCENRSKLMREKYGDDFYLLPRPRKHRYIYVTGNGKDKKRLEPLIRYKKENYV
jgi:hypothetical protein